MTRHRLLPILFSVVALGIGCGNLFRDEYAVGDAEASQLVGGCESSYGVAKCTKDSPCTGSCFCGSGEVYAGSSGDVCGGGSNASECGTVWLYCTGS
jgi:hypothetical protein